MKKIAVVLILSMTLLVPARFALADFHEMTLLRLEKVESELHLMMKILERMDTAKIPPEKKKKIVKKIKHIEEHIKHVAPKVEEVDVYIWAK